MNKLAIAALVLMGAIGSAQAGVKGSATDGQTKAAVCMGCHGPDGNSFAPIWPKLAGQHPGYIAKQLADFKSGARQDPTMSGMAAPLSEQDMADVAAYFSSQKVAAGTANSEKVALGAKIYRGGIAEKGVSACMACHGPNGAGNPAAKFPALRSQHSAYVDKAVKDFRSGTRANDLNKMMRDVASRMSDAEIEAVAEYIAGLN